MGGVRCFVCLRLLRFLVLDYFFCLLWTGGIVCSWTVGLIDSLRYCGGFGFVIALRSLGLSGCCFCGRMCWVHVAGLCCYFGFLGFVLCGFVLIVCGLLGIGDFGALGL